MHSSDWSRLLTERQREVLSIVVENKVYRNRDSKIPELAAQMGIAPAAVAKHLLEIEKTALLNVVVSPSEQGKRVYERLELEPRPEAKQTAEALDRNTVTILRFLHLHPDASTTEVAEELGFSEYTTVNSLRVLMAVQLITKQRGPAVRRGVPPYVYRPTAHRQNLAVRFPAEASTEGRNSRDSLTITGCTRRSLGGPGRRGGGAHGRAPPRAPGARSLIRVKSSGGP